ncbi:hypothetical protein DL771_009843 [Monosporascus sp. 5C6A]|nr:hypothetical protein DL771_009843 [Monosporascus sp. 5C6A]
MSGPPNSPYRSRRGDLSVPSSQSIPLRDLELQNDERYDNQHQPRDGLQALTAGLNTSAASGGLPAISTYWDGYQQQQSHNGTASVSPSSPLDASALQYALPPDINPPGADVPPTTSASTQPYATTTPYYDETAHIDYYESDMAPLTSAAQPISGALATPQGESQPRDSFQTVSDLGNSPSRSRGGSNKKLGYDLETGYGPTKHRSYGASLTPTDNRSGSRPGSRRGSTSDAFYKAGSLVRAMSQRVVNIGGEGETRDHRERRERSRSRSPSVETRRPFDHSSIQMEQDTSYSSQVYPESPLEKRGEPGWTSTKPVAPPRIPMKNPLKGRSLGIFSPENPIRMKLCDLLVNPYMEPVILLLIVLQAVLLTVESAHNVFEDKHKRPERWDPSSWINWAMLGLFIVFTLEIAAHIIVSGFILNAAEYSTIDRKKGIRTVVTERYNAYFRPQRQKSVKTPRQEVFGPSTFARSFTMMHGQTLPETLEDQQRMQLARRAFLRHSFNRLDFIAVVSFWITFALSITGLEMRHHVFVFRMMSCLRIVRLLAITNGTAIILQSLKKAAPLLVRVAFLIGFFWLLFAIIGVQSFKSSLRRQCVWRDPLQPDDFSASFTNEDAFCGGHIDNETGELMPWVKSAFPGSFEGLTPGTDDAKGYLCPRGSICLEQSSPHKGTVNFDDIVHSLELVFVIMSANTWSDLMYITMKTDFHTAALFYGAGIMIMMLWLTNLMIAVVTSSFQVIREESKASAFTSSQDPLIPVDDKPIPRVSNLQRKYDRTSLVWVLIIAYDILCQSLRSDEMSQLRGKFIDTSEIVVTVLLDIEIAIRFAANWRGFHKNTRNNVDLFLAVSTTVILLPPIRGRGVVYAWLTIFQILRVYRVVLAIPTTRELILLVLGNASGIANLILFVFLITFMMALFAVQLFRGEIPQYDEDDEMIYVSFYNIFNSFVGMWQILSSEDWTSILYNVTSYTTDHNTSWYGAAFLIGWMTLAWFIILNMFIAVIQENFDVSEDEKRLEQVKAFLQRKELGRTATNNLALSEIFSFGKNRKRRDPLDYGPATMEMLLKDAVVRDFLDESLDPLHEDAARSRIPPGADRSDAIRLSFMESAWRKVRNAFSSKEPNPFYTNLRFDGPNDNLDPRQMARQVVSAAGARRKAQREYLARHPTYNNSLYIFTPHNRIRRLCQRLVGPGRGSERFEGVEPHKIAWYTFSALIYAAVIAMVFLACVTTPLYQKEYWEFHEYSRNNWFVWIDASFAILFTVESVIKIIADGLFFTPNAYYRSSWGIIDGVVLITLWINVVTLLASDGTVSRAVGAFKAFRALRLLNISNSTRDTFHSLIIVGGWKIISAALVSLSLLIPFAIYAVTLFNGQLVMCNDGDVTLLSECFGEFESAPFNKDWPLLAPRVAANPFYDFNDFGSALFTLFQIVSQEGWVDVSFSAQSITGRGNQPRDMAAIGNAMFFVVFNLMGTVFVLTLFISVFMRNYTEQTGVAFLTAEQRSWLELRNLLRQISPSRTSYHETGKKWEKWCHKRAIEKRGKWYTTITVVLVLHLILLMLEYYPEPRWWTDLRNLVFLAFNFIYAANIVIRIVGFGWKRFRRSSWDVYSLFVIAGAFVTSAMYFLAASQSETFAQLHKIFLVAIVLLLIPRNDALDQLFKTAAASLSTITNLLATWLVAFLVFAIAFTQTFSLTRFGPNADSDVNFRTVPKALILLFRMSVGEGWNKLMEVDFATVTPPLCVESRDFFESDCGSTGWARALFVAWNLLSMYIFVNLFISLIYESFSYVYQRSSKLAHVERDDIRRFKEAWRSVDPAGTGFISKHDFYRLLGELSGVFEMRIYDADDSVRQILDDIRTEEAPPSRHASIVTASAVDGVDIRRLNERLAQIDVHQVRERRRRYNIFCEEVMVSADADRGISFTTVLMILAHYKIISDNKSLRLEEFLRRRARLQRVEEEVRRRVVLGFFDTLRFKKHMERKRAGRMTAIPQLDVPDIFVEDEGDCATKAQQRNTVAAPSATSTAKSSDLLGATDAARPHHQSWSSSVDISTYDSTSAHPLSFPRATPSMPGHQSQRPALSFELQEGRPSSGENSSLQAGSVSPAQVRDLLDDSIWVESIRRSATMRRSRGSSR